MNAGSIRQDMLLPSSLKPSFIEFHSSALCGYFAFFGAEVFAFSNMALTISVPKSRPLNSFKTKDSAKEKGFFRCLLYTFLLSCYCLSVFEKQGVIAVLSISSSSFEKPRSLTKTVIVYVLLLREAYQKFDFCS